MNKGSGQTQDQTKPNPSRASGVVQRKCACGNHTVASGECAECAKKEHSLQRKTSNHVKPNDDTSLSRIRAIQRKLTIGASDDPLEQEADRVADQVMSMPANTSIGTSPPRIQRFTDPPSTETDVAPPSVDRVLASSGHPLEPSLRQDMEQRFGYNFSRVRVHSGPVAEQSARDVNAYAYTVGNNVVFGAGQYAPSTAGGQRLVAHELTHVVQQSELFPGENRSQGSADSNKKEREIEKENVTPQLVSSSSSTQALSAGQFPVLKETRPILQRWKIDGNLATSDNSNDTLGRLAQKAGAQFNDWKCIKPISMRTSTLAKPPANFNDRYELYVQIGDKFDISNLTAEEGTFVRTFLLIYLFDDATEAMDADVAKLFYPGSVSSLDADTDFDSTSNSGSTPIVNMVIFGHAQGGTMWGGASRFAPGDFDPEEPKQSFALAHAGLFPRRCWFSRNASVRAVGCDSETWGQDFAAHYLRKGASVITTTRSVRPTCTAPLLVNGVCQSYDGLDFASSPARDAARLDGPFSTAADFHASIFWQTIKGKL